MSLVLAGMASYGVNAEMGDGSRQYISIRRGQAVEPMNLPEHIVEHLRTVVTMVGGQWRPAFVEIGVSVSNEGTRNGKVSKANVDLAKEAMALELAQAKADLALAHAKAAEEEAARVIAQRVADAEAAAKAEAPAAVEAPAKVEAPAAKKKTSKK